MKSKTPRGMFSVDEYLASELTSPVRREYVAGYVYVKADEILAHSRLGTEILVYLHPRLRDTPCHVFSVNASAKFSYGDEVWFYYPDVCVTCAAVHRHADYLTSVTVVFEVLSPNTRRIDFCEKKAVYLAHPPLAVYALVETDEPRVTVFRRAGEEFVTEEYEGLDAVLPLPEIGAELPLAEIYRRVEFSPAGE